MLQNTGAIKEISGNLSESAVTNHFVKKIGLRYGTDNQPGIARIRKGKGFIYLDEKGQPIKKKTILIRIKKLVIPPAWQKVWISRFETSHIQVTGRDARGRKQYKYHPEWSAARNEVKFDKLQTFGKVIGKLRAKIKVDLKKEGMPKEKVLAAILKLMEETHIRIGNDTYARENNSYGLTTIRNNHVKVKGSEISFNFKGKSGVINTKNLNHPVLSKIIKRCQDLPGEELFGYIDDKGIHHDITSEDVNTYIKENSGADLTAKDFRTWGASTYAIEVLLKMKDIEELSDTAWKKRQCEVIKKTSQALTNTVAICRKYYVHPKIFEAAKNGSLYKESKTKARGLKKPGRILMGLLK